MKVKSSIGKRRWRIGTPANVNQDMDSELVKKFEQQGYTIIEDVDQADWGFLWYRIKVLVRRNLKMSSGKIAAQAVHAALWLKEKDSRVHHLSTVVVLEVSDKKYNEAKEKLVLEGRIFAVCRDAGYTEVEPGTETCLAFLEEVNEQESGRPQTETG